MNNQYVLFEAEVEVDILESSDGIEWELHERENAAKGQKQTHEAFERWCKSIMSKENKKDLMLKLVEHISGDKKDFSIRLMVDYDSNSPRVCEELTMLKNRLNSAIKGLKEVFERIHKKNPKNPSAVLLSQISEGDNSVLVENSDVLSLAEELRQNLSKRKEKITFKIPGKNEKVGSSDGGSSGEVVKAGEIDLTIDLHVDGPVLQEDSKTMTIEVNLAEFSDDSNSVKARPNQEPSKKYNFSWSSGQPIPDLRDNLLLDLKDRVLVKLLVCPLTQLRNGREIVRGYSIVKYLGRVQGELDFGHSER